MRIISPTADVSAIGVLETEIVSVIRMYAQRSIELLLTFGLPLPDWILELDVEGQRVAMAQLQAMFVARLFHVWHIDETWLSTKLSIEPLNEINGFNPDPYYFCARFDNEVDARLKANQARYKEVVMSSIISGTEWQYLDWIWKYGSVAQRVPNILSLKQMAKI